MLVKISSKGQVTIPLAIRKKIDLKKGDYLAFRILESGGVMFYPLSFEDLDYYKMLDHMLAPEWLSPEDEEAFRDL